MFSLFRKRSADTAVETTASAFAPKTGWITRLKSGLQKTTQKFSRAIDDIFVNRKLDAETIQQLEDSLIEADLGVTTAQEICAQLAAKKLPPDTTAAEIREHLSDLITAQLGDCHADITPVTDGGPYVVLVSGVNGAGKTTSIGKIAQLLAQQNYRVMVAAGDTFRAAAREQLAAWAERGGVTYFQQVNVHDPAALAYAALDAAMAEKYDVLLIDTAGRLQSNHVLMDQLAKIPRVLQKKNKSLPHASWLVLDATSGQNALTQVEAFGKAVALTGLIITKLDGTAKGGVVVPIVTRSRLPVVAIGVGEGIDDLQSFDPKIFARQLVGLETETNPPSTTGAIV